MTPKNLVLTDALGNLLRFVLLPGQRSDTVGVFSVLPCLRAASRMVRLARTTGSLPVVLERVAFACKAAAAAADVAITARDRRGFDLSP
jgi:hypothetical protein